MCSSNDTTSPAPAPLPDGFDVERERIACLLGLGGGELADEPWTEDQTAGDDGAPDDLPWRARWWFEGAPEWAYDDPRIPWDARGHGLHTDADDRTWEYRTLYRETYWTVPIPFGWERVATFGAAEERDCWWCGDGTGNEGERARCALCEGDGYVGAGPGQLITLRRLCPDD